MLNKQEIVELQEKLIIIYKYLQQKNMLNTFYGTGDLAYDEEITNHIIQEIFQLDKPKDFLKGCIMELETKKPLNIERDYDSEDFNCVINTKTVEYLSWKYYLKDSADINNLDLELIKKI